MSATDDGGPAFPMPGDDWTAPGPDGLVRPKSAYGWEGRPGMSLRDYFAAHEHVVGTDFAHDYVARQLGLPEKPATPATALRWVVLVEATYRYAMADAMLAARRAAAP